MRIERLDLIAYGPFTEHSIVFGGGGLDVVYGLNEAGKSSALRALGALLYGIPRSTSDNFKHDNKELRVGGKLALSDGSSREFIRRKGNKNTLLGPDGRTVIPEGELALFLGAVDRGLFEQLFGLDHQTLVEGGRVILDGEGELGESLLAASTGGASLKRLLQSLEEEAEGLFKPRARSSSGSAINALLGEYEAARKRAADLSISAGKWEELVKNLGRAEQKRSQLAAVTAGRQQGKSRLERLSHALPVIARRKDLLVKLEALGEVAQLPEDFGQRRRKAEDLLLKARNDLERASREAEALEKKLAGLEVPEALLSQEENIGAIHRRLGSHNKAMEDLPARESDREGLLARARAILHGLRPDLTLKEADSLRAGLSAKALIRELSDAHSRISTRMEIAREGIREEEERIERSREELELLGGAPDTAALKAALEALRAEGDLTRAAAELEEEIEREAARARVELSSLPLWRGTLEELAALPVPAQETVDVFEGRIEGLRSELGAVNRDIEKLEKDLAAEIRNRDRIAAGGEVPDEEALRAARSRRDYGWKLVKRAWLEGEDVTAEEREYDPDRPLSEAYEAKVAEADAVADRMREEADRAAELSRCDLRVRELEAELKRLEEKAEALQTRLEKAEEEWAEAWRVTGITPLTPREMRSWLGKRAALVQAAQRMGELRQRLDRVKVTASWHLKRLCVSLSALGEEVPEEYGLEAVSKIAINVCEHADTVEAERKRLESGMRQLRRRLDSRKSDLEEAREELAAWKAAWVEAVTTAGLPAEIAPSDALSYLDGLDELFRVLDEAEGHGKRIADIRRDAERFREDVNAFVSAYAPELEGMIAEQAAAELHARFLKAKAIAAEADAVRGELERQAEEAKRAKDLMDEAESALGALCAQADCSGPDELEEAERRYNESKSLLSELEEIEKQLLPLRKGEPLDKLLAEAEEVDADALPGMIAAIEAELEELGDMRSRLDEEIGGLRRELESMVGGEEAALEAERAESALAALRPLVERYAELRAAYLLLRDEADRYMRENQDPVLASAGKAFSLLTAGRFQGLDVEYDEHDRPVIVGVRASGEKVGVEGMSDGTCDQLYLALRIASIEAFLEGNEPFPFIVDDILIRFDDQRARAAIGALLELSEKTQVIFFTHHARLVEIAREVAGDGQLTVNELELT